MAPRRARTRLKCTHHLQPAQSRAGSVVLNDLSKSTCAACALASFPILPGVTVEFYLPPLTHTQNQEKTEIFQLRDRVKTAAPLKTPASRQMILPDRNFSEGRTISATWDVTKC